jgi:hypothetical protein
MPCRKNPMRKRKEQSQLKKAKVSSKEKPSFEQSQPLVWKADATYCSDPPASGLEMDTGAAYSQPPTSSTPEPMGVTSDDSTHCSTPVEMLYEDSSGISEPLGLIVDENWVVV